MREFIRVITLIIVGAVGTFSLSGCQSMAGNTNGLSRDAMPMVLLHKNPDYGKITAADYLLASYHANDCLHAVHQQQAGLGEVMVTNGIMGAAGVAGGEAGSVPAQASMLGEHLVRGAVPAVTVAGAILGGAQGAVNGIQIKSNAVTAVVGTCANADLHDPVTLARNPGSAGLHVFGSLVRTSNRTGKLPAWIKPKSVTAVPAGKGDTRDPDSE